MRYFFIFLFSLAFLVQKTYAGTNIDDKYCKIDQKYFLSVFNKDDATFISENCEVSAEKQHVVNYLSINNKKLFIDKVLGREGNGQGVKLNAVSIYKKNNKIPLLITLHSEIYCCYPQPSGKLYTVGLHQVSRENNAIKLKPITSILGDDYAGLDGVSDDYMHFKFKNIASIKKWLDKNYK